MGGICSQSAKKVDCAALEQHQQSSSKHYHSNTYQNETQSKHENTDCSTDSVYDKKNGFKFINLIEGNQIMYLDEYGESETNKHYKWRNVVIHQIDRNSNLLFLKVDSSSGNDSGNRTVDLNSKWTRLALSPSFLSKEQLLNGIPLSVDQRKSLNRQLTHADITSQSSSFNNSSVKSRSNSSTKILTPVANTPSGIPRNLQYYNYFKVGNYIHIYDASLNIWRKAVILRTENTKVLINYCDFDENCNQVLDVNFDSNYIRIPSSESQQLFETSESFTLESENQQSSAARNSDKQNKTPVSRETKLSENQAEIFFYYYMRKAGMIIYDMEADGNCLFRSVAHQVYCDENRHLELRKLCVAHMRKHRQRFEIYCATNFDKYCLDMLLSGTWGDDLEIRALEEIFDRPFFIYSPDHYKPLNLHSTSESKVTQSCTDTDNENMHSSDVSHLNEEESAICKASAAETSSKIDVCSMLRVPIPMNTNYNEQDSYLTDIFPIKLSYHGKSHYNSVEDILHQKLPIPLRHNSNAPWAGKLILMSRIKIFEQENLNNQNNTASSKRNSSQATEKAISKETRLSQGSLRNSNSGGAEKRQTTVHRSSINSDCIDMNMNNVINNTGDNVESKDKNLASGGILKSLTKIFRGRNKIRRVNNTTYINAKNIDHNRDDASVVAVDAKARLDVKVNDKDFPAGSDTHVSSGNHGSKKSIVTVEDINKNDTRISFSNQKNNVPSSPDNTTLCQLAIGSESNGGIR